MDPENYDTDSESESEETNDESRENCDVSQSLKNGKFWFLFETFFPNFHNKKKLIFSLNKQRISLC